MLSFKDLKELRDERMLKIQFLNERYNQFRFNHSLKWDKTVAALFGIFFAKRLFSLIASRIKNRIKKPSVLLRRHKDGTTVKTSLGRRQSRVVNEEKISFIGK